MTVAVRITDAVIPQVFTGYMLEQTKVNSAFYQSPAVMENGQMSALLAGGGTTFNLPFWKDLADNESLIADDNPDNFAVNQKMGSSKQIVVRQVRTQAWGTARLVAELAGSDPQKAIASRVGAYWARQFDLYLISTIKALLLDNVANFSSDMVYDISGLTGLSANLSAFGVLEARQTMGDAGNDLSTLVVHSRVATNLLQQDLITFIPPSQGKTGFMKFMDYQLVIDDRMPLSSGTYTSVLLGNGCVAWGESLVARPVEVYARPDAGNGMGADYLYTRRQFALHPMGYQWLGGSVAGQFPTAAELALAANWTRIFPERKQVPIAFVKSKG